VRDDSLRLRDIRDAIARIEKYSTCSRSEFIKDELVQVWVIHHLPIIGEAARGISHEFREKYPAIPWPKVIGLRNILVHHYFSIDPAEIWRILESDIPRLGEEIGKAIRSESGEE